MYNSPGGSTDQRFRVVPNYVGPSKRSLQLRTWSWWFRASVSLLLLLMMMMMMMTMMLE